MQKFGLGNRQDGGRYVEQSRTLSIIYMLCFEQTMTCTFKISFISFKLLCVAEFTSNKMKYAITGKIIEIIRQRCLTNEVLAPQYTII